MKSQLRIVQTLFVAGCMVCFLLLAAILFQRHSQINQAKQNLQNQATIVSDFITPLWGNGSTSDFVRVLGSVSRRLNPDYLIVSDEKGLVLFSFPRVDLLYSTLPQEWLPLAGSVERERNLDREKMIEVNYPVRMGLETDSRILGHVIMGIEKSKITNPIDLQLASFAGLLGVLLISFFSWFARSKIIYDRSFSDFKIQISKIAASQPTILSSHPRAPSAWKKLLEDTNSILAKFYEAEKQLIQAEKASAIARTTQSLAHDVRKPFTMFKMIIDAVEGEDDPEEAKQILRESLPEVQQAMASVNGMISDVLEIGSESAPITEPTNPETLIESTLNEIFRVYPESQVSISYSLNHCHKVKVDTLKIGRVFSNIVGNAVQAMSRKGSLWFKTDELEEEGKHFILFCIGNGGSFIPAEHLAKLFEAFFTSGKKGGTGLGLAIAQKIVTAHGGKIWCESDEQRGVEFFFTIPMDVEKTDIRPQQLPTSSAQIVAVFERLRGNSKAGSKLEVNPLEVTLEKEILKHVLAANAPLNILVVDDEGVYRNSLTALVSRSEELKKHVHLSFAVNSSQALDGAKASPALVIQDVDLGRDSLNGYEVLKALRAQGFQGVVCIHSNRSLPEDYKVAVEAGADAVLPKPMSRTHFLKLMLQAAERAHVQKSAPNALPEFAILDDSKMILRAWKRKMAGVAVVHAFESPEAFRSHAALNDGFLAGLTCVITDFYFDEEVLENGLMFADELRLQMTQPIFLCSDGEFTPEMVQERVDKVISKDPVSWEELFAQVKALARS